ncbi:putative PUA domain profile [Candidatus Nitrososphaera gargensis Ga9.2]|uniref:Putative PUA domain profile n=1 Tax=Nitrososphaera gargensis (strain Ga9.2) TaxID=1237085 RepID=K0IP29_NITGG|nr:putative PUA domain profile [Candidatus Nitrososphaera gargensis Ga9.2]
MPSLDYIVVGCNCHYIYVAYKTATFYLNPLPIDAREKVCRHIDALFGVGVSEALPADVSFEFSKRTGRIKNFSIGGRLAGTLRTDGGIALTIAGAQHFFDNSRRQFRESCVAPVQEAVPFVSGGRSLFCRHVEWCGSNVQVGSDVAVVDDRSRVIAVGVAILPSDLMKWYSRGVAVKIREGLKGRME